MKKNIEQLTLWMKTHKKKVAACVAVILLALGALGIGLSGMQKENQKAVIAKADQEKKVDEKQTKKTDLKEEKTSKDDSKKKEPETKDAAKETTEVKTEEERKHLSRILPLLHKRMMLPKQRADRMQVIQEAAEIKMQLRYIPIITIFRSIHSNG